MRSSKHNHTSTHRLPTPMLLCCLLTFSSGIDLHENTPLSHDIITNHFTTYSKGPPCAPSRALTSKGLDKEHLSVLD